MLVDVHISNVLVYKYDFCKDSLSFMDEIIIIITIKLYAGYSVIE